jgi:hypothetical protein
MSSVYGYRCLKGISTLLFMVNVTSALKSHISDIVKNIFVGYVITLSVARRFGKTCCLDIQRDSSIVFLTIGKTTRRHIQTTIIFIITIVRKLQSQSSLTFFIYYTYISVLQGILFTTGLSSQMWHGIRYNRRLWTFRMNVLSPYSGTKIKNCETLTSVSFILFQPWRWRQNVPWTHHSTSKLHNVTFHQTALHSHRRKNF